MSQSRNWLSTTTLAITSLLVGCGSGGSKPKIDTSGPPLQKVDITVTPTAATITLYSSVELTAAGSSLIQGTKVNWAVEQNPSCTLDDPFLDHSACTSGWLYEWAPPTNVIYYAPITPGTYQVVANATLPSAETGQSVATVTVTPVRPAVDVTGTWSGTLTITNWTPGRLASATINLSQDGTGVVTGTFITPEFDNGCLVATITSLPMTGFVDAATMSVSGSDDPEQISASIQATVDASGQQMNGTFSISQGNPMHAVCPGSSGTLALTKH